MRPVYGPARPAAMRMRKSRSRFASSSCASRVRISRIAAIARWSASSIASRVIRACQTPSPMTSGMRITAAKRGTSLTERTDARPSSGSTPVATSAAKRAYPPAATAGMPKATTGSSLMAKKATPSTTSIGAGERNPRYHATTSDVIAQLRPKTRATVGP